LRKSAAINDRAGWQGFFLPSRDSTAAQECVLAHLSDSGKKQLLATEVADVTHSDPPLSGELCG
jgi:hypothetical protein